MDGSLFCLHFPQLSFSHQSIKVIPIGTAYAVWTRIRAVGTALIGVFFLKESAEFWPVFFIL